MEKKHIEHYNIKIYKDDQLLTTTTNYPQNIYWVSLPEEGNYKIEVQATGITGYKDSPWVSVEFEYKEKPTLPDIVAQRTKPEMASDRIPVHTAPVTATKPPVYYTASAQSAEPRSQTATYRTETARRVSSVATVATRHTASKQITHQTKTNYASSANLLPGINSIVSSLLPDFTTFAIGTNRYSNRSYLTSDAFTAYDFQRDYRLYYDTVNYWSNNVENRILASTGSRSLARQARLDITNSFIRATGSIPYQYSSNSVFGLSNWYTPLYKNNSLISDWTNSIVRGIQLGVPVPTAIEWADNSYDLSLNAIIL